MPEVRARGSAPGRPYVPIRANLKSGRRCGCENRIAWMLRTCRRYGANERYARMAVFAQDFGGELGRPVATSQISRWESGETTVRFATLRAYEDVLKLPTGNLVGIADALYRQVTVGLAPSRLLRHTGQDPDTGCDRIEVLVEQALSGAEMSGADWDELTGLLTTVGHVVLRTKDWKELVNRLLAEQLVASGGAWRPRNESTHRLLWLSRSRPHVIAACAALVRDSSSQIVVEPLAILDMACHPNASRLLAEQVTHPTSAQALRGALLASIAHVRLRHFSAQQLRQVVSAAVELLLDSDPGTATGPLAARLLRELPAELRQQTFDRVRPAAARDRSVANVLASGRIAEPGPATVMVARVTAEAVAHLPDHVDGTPDELFPTLVGEILHDPNPDVRLHAAQLVGATPLAGHLADALWCEIAKPAVLRDPALAGAILDAMPFLGGSRHRRLLEDIIVADGLPSSVVNTAAWSIGHVPGATDDRYWRRALDHHRAAWHRRRAPECAATVRGLVYSLGTAGHQTMLSAVADDPAMPAPARSAARWWHNLPSLITTSARN